MSYSRFRKRLEALLAVADVRIDGDRPRDIQVHNEALFPRVFSEGTMGFGEGYMDGWWDCERLDEMAFRVGRAEIHRHFRPLTDVFYLLSARLIRLWGGSKRVDDLGERHYELGLNLFRAMLGERMMYSCAYWKDAGTLDEAQDRKLDLIARKLQFEPGMRVLDIGCGWGGAIHYFAEKYGVSGVAVTPSPDQYAAARDLCAGLPVEIRRQDYREVDERFDRIYSIDMIGHVGRKHYKTYMEHVRRCLAPGGLSLVQTRYPKPRRQDGRVGRAVHIPGQRHPVGEAAHGRRAGRTPHGRLAQLSPGLRPHVPVLVRQSVGRVGGVARPGRRAVLSHVALLSTLRRRWLPVPGQPDLADRFLHERRT